MDERRREMPEDEAGDQASSKRAKIEEETAPKRLAPIFLLAEKKPAPSAKSATTSVISPLSVPDTSVSSHSTAVEEKFDPSAPLTWWSPLPHHVPKATVQRPLSFGGAVFLPTYFICDWPRSYFADRRPSSPTSFAFEASMKWTDLNTTLTILSVKPSSSTPPCPDETYYRNAPLLKSHLQKCVRRCRAPQAASTAKHLARLHLDALLRRLPIIMIEDSMLQDSFTTMVWLMAAHAKGFILSKEMLDWIIGAAGAIAACDSRDEISFDPLPTPFKVVSPAVARLPEAQRDAIIALRLRRAFGGMGGDMNMLDNSAALWLKRWSGRNPPPLARATHTATYDSVADLRFSDWELAAVDGHCTDIVDQLVRRSEVDVPAAKLKSLMWIFGGSVSKKKGPPQEPQDPTDRALWTKLEPTIRQVAMQILQARR